VAKEIARKCLVDGGAWRANAAGPGVLYRQGYLSAGANAGCTVRVRIGGERAFLMAPTPRRPRGAPNARRPAAAVAAERIQRLHRRALREGAAITAISPAADLHELRKTCKKLRYLVELFQSLLDPDEAAAAVDTLKGLQDELGRHQDLQVQADALLGFARELARGRKASPPAFLAMGMLIERLREEQARARGEFAERFAAFSRRSARRRWKRMIGHAAESARRGRSPARHEHSGGAEGEIRG
jgi:inorganic triphosphatase YgiF